MNSIGFLWWENEVEWENSDRPFSKEWKSQDYATYTELLEEKNIEVYCADYRWYKNGRLKRAWYWNGENWEKKKDIEIDGVYDLFRHSKEKYDLKKEMEKKVKVLNNPEVAEICQDKIRTYELFSEYMPETMDATEENVERMLEKHGKVIIKPRYGSEGEDIRKIESLKEFQSLKSGEWLVQKFIETEGVPDLGIEGYHDIRILVVNGEVIGGYIRIPEEGSYLSNVAQGGSKNYIDLSKVPEKLFDIVEDVEEDLKIYRPSIYTVDFIVDSEKRPKIVELNSQPGVYYHGPGRSKEWELPWMKKIVEALAEIF